MRGLFILVLLFSMTSQTWGKNTKKSQHHSKRHHKQSFNVKVLNNPVKDVTAHFEINTREKFEFKKLEYKVVEWKKKGKKL